MQKLDIIKIHKRTEEIYLDLKEKYPDSKELNELRHFFIKILELLNRMTIKEVSGEDEPDKEI